MESPSSGVESSKRERAEDYRAGGTGNRQRKKELLNTDKQETYGTCITPSSSWEETVCSGAFESI